MNIFIAGGGRVGSHLAKLLCADRQNVTVIEANPDEAEKIDYALDVSTVVGDARSVMLLQSLGAGGADLFVAAMGNDEVNLIAAATAKGLGAKQVAARVNNAMYVESQVLYESLLSVDYLLSPDSLAALEIANFIEHPGVLATEVFGRGLVQMRQVRTLANSTADGKALKDIILPRTGVLLGLISRNGDSIIPHGDTVVQAGDLVTLIGHREKMDSVQKLFWGHEARSVRVAIMGGGVIGLRLALTLDDKIKTVKLFERREERANYLATQLKRTKVVCRDATSRAALEQEHIDDFDVFVAATGDDERNIMAGVLAKEVGAKRVAVVVHQPDFAPLVERLGIDAAVTPRSSIANSVLRIVHQGQVTALAVLGEGQVEVLEFTAEEGARIVGVPLRDCKSKFPRGALVATILRGEKVIVPSGDDTVLAGDSVILIASSESLEDARKLFLSR